MFSGHTYFCNFLYEVPFNRIISLENSKTVAAKRYIEECLSNVLKQVEKHRRPNDLIMHHDNASSHKATQTMEYLEVQRIELMSHPTCLPDLSPCNFWLFPKVKEQLPGKNCQDMNALHADVQEQIEGLRKEDFY